MCPAPDQKARAVEKGERLNWWRSDLKGRPGRQGYAEYQTFKELVSRMAELLLTEPRRCRRQYRSPLEAFLEITGGDQGSGTWISDLPKAPPKK